MPIQSCAHPSAPASAARARSGVLFCFRQVRRDDVDEMRRIDPREQLRRGLVAQVPEAPGDALLERSRIAPALEHRDIVIAFEHQRVAPRQARLHVRRRHTEIGQNPQPMRTVADHILHRLARVVRNGDGPDFERADREGVVAVEAIDVRHPLETLGHLAERPECRPYRGCVARGKRRHPADVVRMLMGDEDRSQIVGGQAAPGEPLFGIANAETAVDQDPGRAGLDDEAIACAAAAERSEAQRALRVT